MGVKLDLKKIALHARNAEYNPKRFAAVIMRIRCVAFFKSCIIIYHKSILGNWNQNTHVTFRSGSRGRRPLSSAPERWCALAPNLRRTAGICRNSGKFQKLPLDLVGPDFGCFSLDLSLYQESMQIADSSYIFCRLAARKYARIVQKLGFPTKFKDFKIQNMVSFFLSRFRTWYMFFDHYLSIIAYLFTQVGSCDVKFPIRLEGLVLTHSQVKNQWFQKEHFASPFASSLDHLLNHMLNLFNDLLLVFKLRAGAVPRSHLQVNFLHFFDRCWHLDISENYLHLILIIITRMVKPRIVLLIFVSGKVVLTGAKVLFSEELIIFSFVIELFLTWWVSGSDRNLWSIWEHLPNPEELQEAVKVGSASGSEPSIRTLDFFVE